MGTSSGSYHLICVMLHLSLSNFRLVTMAWYAWLVIIGFLCRWLGVSGTGSLARDLWLGAIGLGYSAWPRNCLWMFGCGALAWVSWLWTCGFGSLAWDIWLGMMFGLGS